MSEVVDLAELAPTSVDDEQGLAELLAKAPRTAIRKARARTLRMRRRGRQNYRMGQLEIIVDLLCCNAFFLVAARTELPRACFGPDREYSAISVWLWECLVEEFDSFRKMEAFFRDPRVWDMVRSTLEEAWPNHPDRRVPARPMTRHQFHRHRRSLRERDPDVVEEAKACMEGIARQQALAMGYFRPGRSSLANPDLRDVVRGDGTYVKARFDALLGEKVEDRTTGVPQQARFDPDALLGRDDDGEESPGYRWVLFHVQDPEHEQEGVVLSFGRVRDGGEPAAAAELLINLRTAIPPLRHYLYDMAVQGAFVNDMYGVGLHPITKLPRNHKGEPANALIEIRHVVVSGGRSLELQIFGLDGVAGMKAVADGTDLFAPFIPRALRDRPGGHVWGEYEFPEVPVVHPDLRGRRILIRLDGETINGRQRPQYLRWINEHTVRGQALLPQRNSTESQNNLIERMIEWGRARSVHESNNTLDLAGFFFARNLKAARAYERRTGCGPLEMGSRPPPGELTAA